MSLPVGEIGEISSLKTPFDHDSWEETKSTIIARIVRIVILSQVGIAICWALQTDLVHSLRYRKKTLL